MEGTEDILLFNWKERLSVWVSSNCELAIDFLIFFHSGCEVIPDVNVNKEKFNIKIKLKEAEDIEVCCSSVSWLGLFYNECQFWSVAILYFFFFFYIKAAFYTSSSVYSVHVTTIL